MADKINFAVGMAASAATVWTLLFPCIKAIIARVRKRRRSLQEQQAALRYQEIARRRFQLISEAAERQRREGESHDPSMG